MNNLIKRFDVPANVRKKTNLSPTQFYEKIDIYDNKMIGLNNEIEEVTWFYKDYTNIQMINANLNSQFARIVFVTSASGNKKELISIMTNENIQGDLNKVLFCSGMFSYRNANDYAHEVFRVLYKAFNEYKEKGENIVIDSISSADEIAKFKKLLDDGTITQEEFDAKKKQLLGLDNE